MICALFSSVLFESNDRVGLFSDVLFPIFAMLFTPILFFSQTSIMVNDVGVWKSIKNSIYVYRHNLILIAMIIVVFFLYQQIASRIIAFSTPFMGILTAIITLIRTPIELSAYTIVSDD
jgi:hypothetical protein